MPRSVLVGLALCLLLPAPAAAQSGEDLLLDGADLLDAGDATAALELFDQAASVDPSLYLVHLYRCDALLALERADDAEAALNTFAASATPEERPDVEDRRAQIAQLRAALAPSAEESAAKQLQLAEDELESDQFEQAAASAASALRLDPSLHSAMVVRALALQRLGQLEDAAGLLRAYRDLRGTLSIDDRVEPALAAIEVALAGGQPPAEETPPAETTEPSASRPLALVVGFLGAYSLTAGPSPARHWGTTQLRLDVPLAPFGLGIHLQLGLSMQAANGYAYGYLPIEIGVVWRIGDHPRLAPYVDGFAIVRYADDTKSASGAEIPGASPRIAVGGGVGGGVEIDLTPRLPVALRVAPEVHVGGAGGFLLHAGVGLRIGFRRPG